MNADGSNPKNLTENEEGEAYWPSWSSRNVDTFTVKLAGQPSSAVKVTVASADREEVTASPDTLTLTTKNWNMPQYVILRGVSDNDPDGNKTTRVTVSVDRDSDASTPEYDDVTIKVKTIDVTYEAV
jgi:hypothetical protein